MLERPLRLAAYTPDNMPEVLRLMQRSGRVHSYPGWRSVEQWLSDSSLAACTGWQDESLAAAMVVSTAPGGTGWLRLLAIRSGESVQRSARGMWMLLLPRLSKLGVTRVYALPDDGWVTRVLLELGYHTVDHVITLRRGPVKPPVQHVLREDVVIRRVTEADLAAVKTIDDAAFALPWRLVEQDLWALWHDASPFVLGYVDGQPTAYAALTVHDRGAHLARLATQPSFQGQGIGGALLGYMLHVVEEQRVRIVTVNTQASNIASQRLYWSFGFDNMGHDLPVLEACLS